MIEKNWEKDSLEIIKSYAGKIEKNDFSKSLAYRDKKYVKLFFDELFSGIQINNNSSFLDIGCGIAFLIDYLKENNIIIGNYLGIDLVKEFIKYCKKKYDNYNFIEGNFILDKIKIKEKYDYVLAVGVLVSRTSNYNKYLLEFIKKMVCCSNKYVLFNVITKIDKDSQNYLNKDEIGGITSISKEELLQILELIPNITYTITDKKIFSDSVDTFIQIKVK